MVDSRRKQKIMRYSDRINTDSDPVSIQAAITDFCFNKCHMCDHHLRENKQKLKVKNWIKFLSGRNNLESVCYAGGDPFTNTDTNEIMQFHIDNDIAFGFITCGFLPKWIDLNLLKEARWVRVSLDSIDKKIYKKIRGGVEVEHILSGIKKMKQNKVNVELTITVSELSKNKLPELFNFISDENLEGDIHPVYGKTFKNLKVADLINSSARPNKIVPYFHGNVNFKKCVAAYYQIYIDSFGDIYPCCTGGGDTEIGPRMKPMGNIKNWTEFLKNRKEFKNNFKFCKLCIDRFGFINHTIENSKIIQNNFF